ncbi:MAG: acetyl-coenzyme A synthetase N-terminal domain-containing protein, partial [Planctomycetota bacterium]
MSSESSIESVLSESRVFPPRRAADVGMSGWHIGSMEEYAPLHRRSIEDPEGFWSEIASELFWFRRWDRALSGTMPDTTWFNGGKTNLCYNCVDRHVDEGHGEEPAIIWEGEPIGTRGAPETRVLTYADLKRETSRFGNVLKAMGVKKGDVVTIYMGMVPELAIAVLACARIGAIHSVVFGG